MSRIGRLPVKLEKGVKAELSGTTLKVEGPKGKLGHQLPPGFTVEINGVELTVKRPGDTNLERSLHGLTRKLIANMAEGVSKGFTKVLEINGVGYRAEAKGTQINLTPRLLASDRVSVAAGGDREGRAPGVDHARERRPPVARLGRVRGA